MKRYLVTGGAGFIGSHIADALLRQGHAVKIFDNFSTGSMTNIERLAGLRHAGLLEVATGDIRDRDAVAEAVRDVEIVFHQAAFVSVAESMMNPGECLDINIGGTTTLLEAARNSGVRRVVLASSAAVYGNSEALPLSEDAAASSTLSPYALSKQVNEMLGAYYAHAYGLQVVALRYFNVYGPRQPPNSAYAAAIPIFINKMWRNEPVTVFGDGSQTRDFVYVGDVVRANLMASEHPHASGCVVNVCSGAETSLLDLLRLMRNFFPDAPEHVLAPPRVGDIYRSLGSTARAEQCIGFSAQVPLSQGLASTVEWLQTACARS